MPERVEFKVFTKMTKNSIVDFKELINYAKSIGLTKVVITDFNNVYNFPKIEKYLKTNNITDFKVVYGVVVNMLASKTIIPITVLVKNEEGLKNLYKIITKIKTTNLTKYGKELITKEELNFLSEGLLYGLDITYLEDIYADLEDNELKGDLMWWDFIEVNPSLNKEYLKRVITIAKETRKILVASSPVCYLKKEEQKDYEMLFKDSKCASFLKSTEELLEDFNFLDSDLAYEIVVTNPVKITDLIKDIKIISDECYLPQIKDSKTKILNIINKKLNKLCGKNIPEVIVNRINEELYGKDNSNNYGIINNNTESILLIIKKLVDKSYDMGYPLFVRGGIASSLIAYLMGITDINPLSPHYYCPKCQEFYFNDNSNYNYGIDMPDKCCPKCQTKLKKDGFNIPYTNFLGVNSEKISDIDINFADLIQKDLINYLINFWGKAHTIRAGVVATTPLNGAKEEISKKDLDISEQEKSKLAQKLKGKFKATGQHPGGLFLIPKDKEVDDFTPCNYPHNNQNNFLSTHFDYHDLAKNIIKFDILGHRLPSIIKELEDLTQVKLSAIPLNDKKVFDLINKGEVEDLFELDDNTAKALINIIKPHNFNDLTKIIALFHSDDLTNKIKKLSKNKELIKDLKVFREDLSNLDDIGYVPLKAHVISYTLIAYKFAWYKVKYPPIFNQLMVKHEKDKYYI